MTKRVVYRGSGLSGIDGKGRVTLPSDFRSTVAASSDDQKLLVLSLHPDLPCLIGFGTSELDRQAEDIDTEWKHSLGSERDYDRYSAGRTMGPVSQVNFEDNGRFVMPPMLRDFGNIADELMFVGASYHIEIWAAEVLEQQEGPQFEIAKRMLSFYRQQKGARK